MSLADLAYTALARREQLPVRRGFVVDSVEELCGELARYAAAPEATASRPRHAPARVLFVYPEGASILPCAVRELCSDPLFRSHLRRCDERREALGLGMISLEQYLLAPEAIRADRLTTQLAGLAIQLALTALLASHGVEPTDVCGGGAGEIAAAVASGALSLDAALRLVVHAQPTAALLHAGELHAPRRRLFSGAAGPLSVADLGAAHWQRVLHEPLAAATVLAGAQAYEGELSAVIEIGVRPVLCAALHARDGAGAASPVVRAALDGEGSARHALLRLLGQLHERGVDIRQRHPIGVRPRLLSLPSYPWQPDRFWLQSAPGAANTSQTSDISSMLGATLCDVPAAGVRIWQNTLDLARHTSLADHQVAERVLLPAAGQIAMMIQALVLDGASPCELRAGRFHKALALEAAPRPVQTVLSYRDGHPATVSIAASGDAGTAAQLYSRAEVAPAPAASAVQDLSVLRALCPRYVSAESLYESLAAAGIVYGPSFQRVRELRVGAGVGLATLEPVHDAAFAQDLIDLRLLDAALHALLPVGRTLPQRHTMQGAVPVGFARVCWFAPLRSSAYAHVTAGEGEDGAFQASVQLLDARGAVLGRIESLSFSTAAQRWAAPRAAGNAHRVLRAAARGNAVAPRPQLDTPYVAPQSDIERTIAGLWQRALGVDRIGIDDSFFELGGDSVFGNQVLVEINRRFGVSIAPERAFERYTVAGLAALVEQQLLEEIEGLSEAAVAQELARVATGSDDEIVT